MEFKSWKENYLNLDNITLNLMIFWGKKKEQEKNQKFSLRNLKNKKEKWREKFMYYWKFKQKNQEILMLQKSNSKIQRPIKEHYAKK